MRKIEEREDCIMNNVQLLGRLTKDVELRVSQKSKKNFAYFTLAVQNGEDAMFIDCVAFDKLAETIEKYVKKGNRLLVEGSINVSTYVDKDGNNRKSTNVFVNKITFIESAKKEDDKKSSKKSKKDEDDEDLPF